MRSYSVLFAVFLAACGGDDGMGGGPGTSEVPARSNELFPYLQARSYQNLTAEPAVHPSAGPHGAGGVRTYFTGALVESLRAGASNHPVGSALVKELYASDRVTVSGWAVMVKTSSQSSGGSWYWYEILSATDGTNPVANGNGVSFCVGCHRAGRDFVQSPTP